MNDYLSGVQLGDYTIGPRLDEGGMGTIYRAFKPDSKDAFVVKILLPEYANDAHFRKRFEREAALLQALQHPHIIPIYDFGEEQGMLYFAMPYIRGLALYNLMRKQKFSPATSWIIVEPVASALTYAHQQNIIHRDLKPANILVETGANEFATRPYLADFGLSKPIDMSAMTSTGMIIGTPQYMAPEQVRAQDVDARTDVYAFGIVVYEMLLGQVPFWEGDPETIAIAQVKEPPPPPTWHNPDFPAPIEEVILRALAKKPADRFDSAVEFGQAYWKAIQSVPLAQRMAIYNLR